jgi:hypothetical protein
MKYRDLIQFEAVTEVIQLVTANKKEMATQLVDSYVISDRMADVIMHRISPALKQGDQAKSRGLFIVGNYGTGKSHLMSVITAVAEHVDLLEHIKYPSIREELSDIAGKFKISRQETTALNVPLRDIVFTQLESDLKKMGVEYHFPGNKESVTNKYALAEMMISFKKVYPEQGLLIALDELLDFLRAKNEKEIIMDLNFLREIGEVCEVQPLRFMAGIQEALFDNPRFQFVADSIQRVKSRFDQASIVREDIAYVISHRLLTKTEQQKKIIRKHLEKYTHLYLEMAERLDDFEEMFPVHPAYIEVFEQVTIGERRELLKALSQEMQKLLDLELPTDRPGLITFDSYWRMISQDNAFRALPDVRNVLDKAQVLTEKVSRAPETRPYKDAALQIIDGLALHRLTVSDIYAPIGITPTELRDRLCIHLDLPEQDADFLLITIETVLKAISKAVNGQFISHNKENDQYYLDLKKDIDYEALIQQKADALDPSTIDRYYFDVLVSALEIKEGSYVPGFRIWESEIPWPGHGITRRGYIFLGASNERSTAHPERDYYIHFHGIFGNGHASLQPKKDEVYFNLSKDERNFIDLLKFYAGAAEMSAISAGSNKDQYDAKVRQTRSKLTQWLRDNFIRYFKIQHVEAEFNIPEAIANTRLSIRDLTFRDQVYKLSGAILQEAFEDKFPYYPSFQGLDLTSMTLLGAAESAIRALGGGATPKTAQVVLEGLEIGSFVNGRMNWSIETSQYAGYYQKLIDQLEAGKVIKRSDLLEGEPGAERDRQFKLEPELLLVILAALLRQGSLSISLQGVQISEPDLTGATRIQLDQLLRFTSISKPKPVPEQALKELLAQFNIDPEVIKDKQTLPSALNLLQEAIQSELNKVVRMLESLREGPKFWQEMILPSEEQSKSIQEIQNYRQFLTSLQNYTTISRMANLPQGVGEIRAAVKAREIIQNIQNIFDILQTLHSLWDYLMLVQSILPTNDPWQIELKEAKTYVLTTLSDPKKRVIPNISGQLRGRLENVKKQYMDRYLLLHNQHRLNRDQDTLKKQLVSDPRWTRLRALSKLSILPSKQLEDVQHSLQNLTTCPNLQISQLSTHAHCQQCNFQPSHQQSPYENAALRMESIQNNFELLYSNWINVLLDNLQSDQAAHNLDLVDAAERDVVTTFLHSRKLPEPLTNTFLNGVENTLQGLEVLVVDGAEYLLALTAPGMPCTPDELEHRIREFLQKQLAGKNRTKTRIQINW